MELRQARKSMLGSRRSAAFSEVSFRKFEMPKSLQIAETLRKQRNVSSNESIAASGLKNLSSRQPRKSMLGTRKLNRDSIIPPLRPSTEENHDCDSSRVKSDSSADSTLTSCELKTAPRVPSLEDEFLRRDSVLRSLPQDVFRKLPELSVVLPSEREPALSPVLHRNVPVRKMLLSCTLADSQDTSFIENETLLATEEESVLATTLTDTTATTENSFLASTLKDEESVLTATPLADTSTVANENRLSASKSEETILSPTPTNTSEIANRSSFLGATLKDITNTCVEEVTLVKDKVSEKTESKKDDEDMLFKMLDLMNTWMRRTAESVETYQKEIADLQKKASQANEEIEDMKHLKQSLIKQFSSELNEKGNFAENLDFAPMATIAEDKIFKFPSVSPTKNYIQEMRSTIKFMKTPLTSRARVPRASVMLTPHSMSSSLKNQFEQLLE